MPRSLQLDPSALLRAPEQRESSDELGTRILDAAAELFVEHGIRRVTVDDIAERCGIGRTTLYRHVGGRRSVIEAVLTRESWRFFAGLRDATSGSGRFEDVVVDGFVAGLEAARRSALPELVRSEPELRDLFTVDAGPIIAAGRDFLVGAFGPVDAAGARQVGLVAELLVRLALSLLLEPRSLVQLDGEQPVEADLHALLDPLLAPLGALRTAPSDATVAP